MCGVIAVPIPEQHSRKRSWCSSCGTTEANTVCICYPVELDTQCHFVAEPVEGNGKRFRACRVRRGGAGAGLSDFRLSESSVSFYRASHTGMGASEQVVVAHKGAREHFLAARAMHRRGQLAALVTDWYSPIRASWGRRVSCLGAGLARALGAASDELVDAHVVALRGFGMRSRWRLARAARTGRWWEVMTQDDADFASRVARLQLPPHEVFLGYSYAALEALRAERARGVLTLVDQIDPGRMEWDLVRQEQARWPDYAEPERDPAPGYYERAEQEWREADAVLVNSNWSREALVRQGVPPARIHVIPLAYEPDQDVRPSPSVRARPLTVLWLGSVILRKGIPYLVEAARRLMDQPVRFEVAGPVGIRAEAIRRAPPNITWRGAVPRSQAHALYRAADVFVLPTISDGFAITQVEALAHGLPVITTPRCGDVVEDGRTGFLIPPADAEALAAAIRRFCIDPGLSAAMRPACLEAASRFSIDAYGRRLNEIICAVRSAREGAPA